MLTRKLSLYFILCIRLFTWTLLFIIICTYTAAIVYLLL